MRAVLSKEFRMLFREKQIVFGYMVVLLLWGVLYPLGAWMNLEAGTGQKAWASGAFSAFNFVAFSAFFLMISITHSNQSFIGEKSSRTLNVILATPVRSCWLVSGKWLATLLMVAVLALGVYAIQWGTYAIVSRISGIQAVFMFPSASESTVALVQAVLFWSLAGWSGAFTWLRFDTLQSANVFCILGALPLCMAHYYTVEMGIPAWVVVSILLFLNALLAFLAVLINHRDRIAQLDN